MHSWEVHAHAPLRRTFLHTFCGWQATKARGAAAGKDLQVHEDSGRAPGFGTLAKLFGGLHITLRLAQPGLRHPYVINDVCHDGHGRKQQLAMHMSMLLHVHAAAQAQAVVWSQTPSQAAEQC